ncbi:hypothetical protein HPB51_010911 [Rhipicephalus microplus]|uniref:Uncharacterized protein n=1 Tax=Rhipicephalus microplus TaxID=6941 RepID=A0A9J6EFX2_RHIMP|nr:hypothetical protein HPB51_010911 [Rhipicephalus microplus]
MEAGCTAAVQYKYCEAALTSRNRPANPGAQALCVNTGANPTVLNNPKNRSWLKAAGTVLDGPRVENKDPLFRDTREPTSTSTPTRLNA